MPELSVIMPVYNVVDYITDSITSVLSQSYTDFEFIIVDDGSTDGTVEIIKGFTDSRIKLVENELNRGVIYAANCGLKLATGRYIARMDSDDIATSDRLEKQYKFFTENPDIDILGGAYKIIGKDTEVYQPQYNEGIKLKMLKNMPFSNPTVMMRADTIRKYNLHYDEDYPSAEDYDFFVEASLKGIKMANLTDVILNYRIHETQITQAKSEEQKETSDCIRKKYFKGIFGSVLNDDELNWFKNYAQAQSLDIVDSLPVLVKLFKENKRNKFFEQKSFISYIYGIMVDNLKVGEKNTGKGISRVFFTKIPLRIRILLLEYLVRKYI